MTFSELDALLVGRNRARKKVSSLLAATRIDDSTIQVDRLYRGRAVPLAMFTRDNKIKFLPDVGSLCGRRPVIESVTKLLPAHSYNLSVPNKWYYRDTLLWRKDPPTGSGTWRDAYNQVHVPYTQGDTYDLDAGYMHAARRNDF